MTRRSLKTTEVLPNNKVRCLLCPKTCLIAIGESGNCRVRVNLDGKLITLVYGRPVALHIDPIEKKPLFHFKPGSPILSLATAGCNLHCKNCQNWEISQTNPWDIESYQLDPEDIVHLAQKKRCPSIAYTYTEPLVYYEYTLDTARLAQENNIYNVLVTAGYLNPGPLRRLYQHIDAANIDLKAMSNDFYKNICDAELKPVLTALELAKKHDVWLEVTNLVIPTLNDTPEMFKDLAKFMVENLGSETPLHFSSFTPRHNLQNLPRTPKQTLIMARDIAIAEGLKYVYVGNLRGTNGTNTYCPDDHTLLIERAGYTIRSYRKVCPACNRPTDGIF